MFNLKHNLLLPAILATLVSTAQSYLQRDTLIRYLGANLQPVPPQQAIHETVCLVTHLPDSILMYQEFYGNTGKKLQVFFLNAADSQRNGRYEAFHPDGGPMKKGYYNKGKKIGVWKEWYENQQLRAVTSFDDSSKLTASLTWYKNGNLQDSTLFTASQGVKFEYFESGSLSGNGSVIGEKKIGQWTYRYPSGAISSVEEYEGGTLVSAACFDEDGTKAKTPCVPDQEARFPGGDQRWHEVVSKKIGDQVSELAYRQATGSVIVDFVIEPDGRIGEIRVVKSSGTPLDEYALIAIRSAPKWIPATKHNVKTKAFRRQNFSFNIR